ncbi:MAG: MarR family transcriptional regulator [Sphingomicrobium sp.]
MDEQTRKAAIRLQGLATRLLRLARSAHGRHGIGSAQYSAMAVLYERGPMALVDLARAERVSHPTMSRVVAALVKIGAADRVDDPADRRSRKVALTAEGQALYEKICSNRVAVTAAILKQLKPATIEEVIDAVERVAGPLEEHITPG